MRIVDVNEFYSPTGGGVRSYVDRKMAVMADLGHELIVLAPGREDRIEERAGGGKIIYIDAPPLPFDRSYGMFWKGEPVTELLDQLDPDVVECSSPWRPAWIVARWQGRALKAFFMHNDNVDSYPKRWFSGIASPDQIERAFAWYSRYMTRFLDQFDTVVTNGPALVKRMEARGIHIDAAMTLGIERQYFSPKMRDEQLRRSLLAQCGLPETGHLLMGVGRHHREKRWDMVIDAVERAGSTLPVGFVLIGEGVQSKSIERRVADSPHIRLFRPVHDRLRLSQLMASCDVFIHGCESETFGLVVSEALASGAPLIVPDEGGAAELARPEFAETYTAGDGKACAAAIKRMLARDQVLLRRAAAIAADKVMSDRDHAIHLVDHYAAQIARRAALAA